MFFRGIDAKRNRRQRSVRLAYSKLRRRSATVAEVVVGLIKPVLAWRVEDVEIDSVFEGPGFVRHVGRDTQDLPCADDDLLAVDGKLKSAFEYVCDLLV